MIENPQNVATPALLCHVNRTSSRHPNPPTRGHLSLCIYLLFMALGLVASIYKGAPKTMIQLGFRMTGGHSKSVLVYCGYCEIFSVTVEGTR